MVSFIKICVKSPEIRRSDISSQFYHQEVLGNLAGLFHLPGLCILSYSTQLPPDAV